MIKVKSIANGKLVRVCTEEGSPIKATAINIEWIPGEGLIALLRCPIEYLDLDVLEENVTVETYKATEG